MRNKFKPIIYSVSGADEFVCYACGDLGSSAIMALTDSTNSARKIQRMYETLGLHANIISDELDDYIKLGACDRHLENLRRLEQFHKNTETITLTSIVQSLI